MTGPLPMDPGIIATTDFLGVTVPYDESGGLLEDLLEVLEPTPSITATSSAPSRRSPRPCAISSTATRCSRAPPNGPIHTSQRR